MSSTCSSAAWAGGIFFLSALFDLIIAPGSGPLFFAPVFFALAALALGCFFLVFELGQPPVFWRVFTTKTAIIKWGAVLLSVAMIFGFVWWASYLYVLGWEWTFGLAAALEGVRPIPCSAWPGWRASASWCTPASCSPH